jgi:hypothetical protein
MRSIIASLAVALMLTGCSSEPEVDWNGKYTPTIKKRLDDLAKEKDCGGLLAELDTAYSINDAKQGGSGDLVAYIKHALERADCDIPED